MSKMTKNWWCILALTGGLLLATVPGEAASAEKQLQKGIEAYQKNDNGKAMDYFIDVLTTGDSEQVALANKYIDAIHNQLGGIKNPVEVNVNFPDQPTQTIVNKAENLANYGTEELDTLATNSEEVVKQKEALTPKTLTEQIEERQLQEYLQKGEQPVVKEKPLTDVSAVLGVQPANGKTTTQADLKAEENQLQAQEIASLPANMEPVVSGSESVAVVDESAPVASESAPVASSVFADLTSPQAVEARNKYTTQKLQSMTDSVIANLGANEGMHLYLRSDGRPDALDIDDNVLFYQNSFRSDALTDLNNIYQLLALTQGARYIILPAGSYTDDVTLGGIRQAMALQSYLVKRGISQGKLHYNMGLVDEEVPPQFSNLKGLSIVFDYDAELPTRLLENEEHEKAPLLSMAIVPPCHAIDRSLGEAYAIDFSVLETVNTLDNWVLQIIQHGRDGNYYIVRQLEGFSPVYHQILWNGRKGIIGPELPCGKYTVVLSGVDLKGEKQTLRRRLIVRCAPDPAPSCQMGTCPGSKKNAQSVTTGYKASRLWKKPGRVLHCDACAKSVEQEEVVEVKENIVQPVEHSMDEQAQATATDSSSYTVTKTVRNVVTGDSAVGTQSTVALQEYEPLPSDAGGYSATSSVSAVDNPYGMPYEEEYTEVSY